MKHLHILLDADDGLVISVETTTEEFDWEPILEIISQNDEEI